VTPVQKAWARGIAERADALAREIDRLRDDLIRTDGPASEKLYDARELAENIAPTVRAAMDATGDEESAR